MKINDGIVFPGEIRQVPICKGSTYCEEVESYPENAVNEAIQRNGRVSVVRINKNIIIMKLIMFYINNVEQVIFPQSAENKNNEWKFIANQENFKQGIRIEKCSKESSSCSVIGGLAEGYKTSCKQKYVYRELASILTDGTVVPDTFRFPSSCCCHVSFSGNPHSRIDVS
ncbi:Protein spaetzle [Eufriesea mexicana]|nr:Protein spaetzle [Eufriesea mexicana]